MATPRLLLLAISCSAALAAPGPGADPAYGLIKTIQLFDDDAASADILRNEVFYSQDEDTQLVFPHNYVPEEKEGSITGLNLFGKSVKTCCPKTV